MAGIAGLPGVEVALRRSAQARRFSLRVSARTGGVTLTLPQRARESEALAFLRAQEDWLRDALARVDQAPALDYGAVLPVEGRPHAVLPAKGRAIRAEAGLLFVPEGRGPIGPRLSAWLRTVARDRIAPAVDRHAAALGRPVAAISLRDTRSRWGSCTVDGRLMFSWRLAMAPPEVLDYVAAHEVAHLVEMNHSDRFWALVERLHPGWQARRAWLRAEGNALQAIRF